MVWTQFGKYFQDRLKPPINRLLSENLKLWIQFATKRTQKTHIYIFCVMQCIHIYIYIYYVYIIYYTYNIIYISIVFYILYYIYTYLLLLGVLLSLLLLLYIYIFINYSCCNIPWIPCQFSYLLWLDIVRADSVGKRPNGYVRCQVHT